MLAAAAVDPADPRCHYMLAEIYQKLGQPADRQRELDLFNKLSAAQKSKGVIDAYPNSRIFLESNRRLQRWVRNDH